MERKDGAGHDQREVISAGSSAGASVASDVAVTERTNVSGRYEVVAMGPMEHERAAYVATRDGLYAAQARVRVLASVVRRETPKKMGALRRVVAAIVVAVGFATMTASPVLAAAQGELMTARAAVAERARALDAFVLERKWEERFDNLVTTVGKNHILDTELGGSSYSVVGPYLGLIDSSAGSVAAGDTMASHAGWTEVGGTNAPAYTGTRKTVSFNAASAGSKAASAASSYAITSAGTVGGCFLVLGTGALSTKDNTAGTLYSCGAFTGGNKVVDNGDTLNVTWTATA